ncbi:MAG: hypothetical protein ABI861_03710 [Panacibacter sp.]
MNQKITWKILKIETGYYVAETPTGTVESARVSSNNRNEIDSLISIIATLTKKQ